MIPPVQVPAAAQAIRLTPVAWPAHPDRSPAAPALIQPIVCPHPTPPRTTLDSAGGSRHIEPAAKPPQAHRNAGGPGSSGIGARALAFTADKHSECARRTRYPGRGQQQLREDPRAGAKPARRQRGRRTRPSYGSPGSVDSVQFGHHLELCTTSSLIFIFNAHCLHRRAVSRGCGRSPSG